jgi:hypothetical protein
MHYLEHLAIDNNAFVVNKETNEKEIDMGFIEKEKQKYYLMQKEIESTFKIYLWLNFSTFLILFISFIVLRIIIIQKREILSMLYYIQ